MQLPTPSADLEHIRCSLCGADDYDVVYEARYDEVKDQDLVEKFRASGDELLIDQLVKCRGCGFQYVSPRLRSDLVFDSYAAGEDPTYVSQLSARERTFDAALGEIEAALGRKGRLLDIGTAAGAFVAAADKRGWSAEGCEPNRWLARWGASHYGITIRQGSVFDQGYEPGSFDVVTLWDVIEHTPDPRHMLEHCRTLLKPGGLLVVNYPDIGSWIARVMGRRWLFLSSVHLYYFDRRTMRRMLETTGFAMTAVRPHIQRLELEYILSRGAVLSRPLSSAARGVVRAAGLSRAQVPYWLGQTFVLARKRQSAAVVSADTHR
jgi:2-polyprenyl-3-methyl-5-hydroxy-6-metoxy-1,4-benzoquinol methylase